MTLASGRHHPTRTERLAAFFLARPQVWIDGQELSSIAGAYAWRTRASELRRPPFNMQIENRQRRVRRDGRAFVISEYRYVPAAATPVIRARPGPPRRKCYGE